MTIDTQGVAKELQAASLDIPNEADARSAEVVLEVQPGRGTGKRNEPFYEFGVLIDGRTYVVTVEDVTEEPPRAAGDLT